MEVKERLYICMGYVVPKILSAYTSDLEKLGRCKILRTSSITNASIRTSHAAGRSKEVRRFCRHNSPLGKSQTIDYWKVKFVHHVALHGQHDAPTRVKFGGRFLQAKFHSHPSAGGGIRPQDCKFYEICGYKCPILTHFSGFMGIFRRFSPRRGDSMWIKLKCIGEDHTVSSLSRAKYGTNRRRESGGHSGPKIQNFVKFVFLSTVCLPSRSVGGSIYRPSWILAWESQVQWHAKSGSDQWRGWDRSPKFQNIVKLAVSHPAGATHCTNQREICMEKYVTCSLSWWIDEGGCYRSLKY